MVQLLQLFERSVTVHLWEDPAGWNDFINDVVVAEEWGENFWMLKCLINLNQRQACGKSNNKNVDVCGFTYKGSTHVVLPMGRLSKTTNAWTTPFKLF